ncbi:MAG: carboxypeptidase-like regulatory domain-containing protein [Myxococcota bacterium]
MSVLTPVLAIVGRRSFAVLVLACLVPSALLAQDFDGDGIPDAGDNCIYTPNAQQQDNDSDGLGNACDNCVDTPNGPLDPDEGENVQRDTSRDGYGNICDGDMHPNAANDGDVDGEDFNSGAGSPEVSFLDCFTAIKVPQSDPRCEEADLDGDDDIDGEDFSPHFLRQFTANGIPGPSGLSCAGTVPCPLVRIDSPADQLVVPSGTSSVDLAGAIDPPTMRVMIDGVDAVVSAGQFSLPAVPLTGIATRIEAQALLAGQTVSDFVTVYRDPPVIVNTVPSDGTYVGADAAVLAVTVDGASSVTVGGVAAVDIGGVFEAPISLVEGQNLLTVVATNPAGSDSQTITVFLDTIPPAVSITAPVDGSTTQEAIVFVNAMATDTSPLLEAMVNGVEAFLEGSSVSSNFNGVSGSNVVTVEVTDAAGNTGAASTTVNVEAVPSVAFDSIQDGAVVSGDTLSLAGFVSGPDAVVTVNGVPAIVSDGTFSVEVPLVEGVNVITLLATNSFGSDTRIISVFQATPPEVSVTSPENFAIVTGPTVAVSGTVDDDGATVEVKGVPATLSPVGDGTATFTATVPVVDGTSLLDARAVDGNGNVGVAAVTVTVDVTPPVVALDLPSDGPSVTSSSIVVTGMVNDHVMGTVNAANVSVDVNGVSAQVSNRRFVATGVPLSVGPNTIIATATDSAGNTGQASVSVSRVAGTFDRLRIISGDGQSGVVATLATSPLEVEVLDEAGLPAQGVPVVFRVLRNNGEVVGSSTSGRVSVEQTGVAGRAQVSFRFGEAAGAAGNLIRASATGYGSVTFYATGVSSAPSMLSIDSGDHQSAPVGSVLARPLMAIVTDISGNRVAGESVTFEVVEGGGLLAGQGSLVVLSDENGVAMAELALGATGGIENNVVRAFLSGAPSVAARFVASGVIPGDPSSTRVSGVVLDNADVPIEGVTVSIDGTSLQAVTDAEGQFELTGAPAGLLHLHVDGTTAIRAGTWPVLEFELLSIAGSNNDVGRPIYLLPIDVAGGLFVDANTGGTLTSSSLPGFEMTIDPGSATFPGGGSSGTVSVTLVNSDKIPMEPNGGQQPRFVITVQPSGVVFDPPARVSFPNTDGFVPGQIVEFYSFDHGLGRFVSIGTGEVSEDGSQVVSSAGVGIVEGGWHCGGLPAQAGSAETLVVRIFPRVTDVCPFSLGGIGALGLRAEFVPSGIATYAWSTPGANVASADTVDHNFHYTTAGEKSVSVTVTALPGGQSASDSITIDVFSELVQNGGPALQDFRDSIPESYPMNSVELALYVLNPAEGALMVNARNVAFAEADARFGRPPGEDSVGMHNAFVHAAWMAVGARSIVPQSLGPAFAASFGEAHEDFDGNSCLESGMDLSNNAFGLELVQCDCAQAETLQAILDEIERAVRANELVINN